MRRFLFSLLAVGFVGVLAGCTHTHGVCDCSWDTDDPCHYRAPWVNQGSHNGHVPNGTTPGAKEVVPTEPKKL